MVLEIVKCGHPILRQKGQPIDRITPEIRQLAADMLETMRAANGVGLAAPQIGQSLQLTVIDVSASEIPSGLFLEGRETPVHSMMPLVLVNPVLSEMEGEQLSEEGCLSVPEITGAIRRAAAVTVRAQGLDGQPICFRCTGLLARAAQHEVDHLNGILFVDRMDAATRASIAGKLKRMQKKVLADLKKNKTARHPEPLLQE